MFFSDIHVLKIKADIKQSKNHLALIFAQHLQIRNCYLVTLPCLHRYIFLNFALSKFLEKKSYIKVDHSEHADIKNKTS